MTELNKRIELLFSRLTDPSGLIRERACKSIADLLLDPNWKDAIEESLFRWMRNQQPESLASLGLLVLLRAKLIDDSFEMPTFAELKDSLQSPSILSWMLLREFDATGLPLNVQNMHSGSAPDDYKIDSFFVRYCKYFLPPEYLYQLDELEKTYHIPIKKQLSFESSAMLRKMKFEPSVEPLYFKGRPEDEHFVVLDFLLSEIYRSAYLRSLAWAVNNTLPIEEAKKLALKTCPIDLGLWRLNPNVKPIYWPTINLMKEGITDIKNEIWKQVNNLCQSQPLSKKEWILAKADGRVFEGSDIFDLSICGFFRVRKGPSKPNDSELINWLIYPCMIDHEVYSLSFEGTINPLPAKENLQKFMDWIVYPASWAIVPKTSSTWQFWRLERLVHFPAPFIVENPMTFKCRKDALTICEGENLIAEWRDWTDGISEKKTANLSFNTGNVLMLRRPIIERFEKKTNSEFCWGCCITKFHRDHPFDYYTEDHDYKIYMRTRGS